MAAPLRGCDFGKRILSGVEEGGVVPMRDVKFCV
jgi:hypothetical protein